MLISFPLHKFPGVSSIMVVHSHQKCIRIPFSAHGQHLLLSLFFFFILESHSIMDQMNFYGRFYFFSCVFWPTVFHPLKHSFAHFLIGLLFCCWVSQESRIRCVVYKCFLPSQWFPLRFVECFLCFEEADYLDITPFSILTFIYASGVLLKESAYASVFQSFTCVFLWCFNSVRSYLQIL